VHLLKFASQLLNGGRVKNDRTFASIDKKPVYRSIASNGKPCREVIFDNKPHRTPILLNYLFLHTYAA